jgi:hypothetical protein
VRARTSGHAILIRDEGNTDPRHEKTEAKTFDVKSSKVCYVFTLAKARDCMRTTDAYYVDVFEVIVFTLFCV